MAARSVNVKFNNETDLAMHRTYVKLDHGVWCENDLPPETIDPHSSGTWCSESNGFMTGTEGEAIYNLDNVGLVKVTWDNPYSGHNSYSASAPKGYEIATSGGSGDNANVTFTLIAK